MSFVKSIIRVTRLNRIWWKVKKLPLIKQVNAYYNKKKKEKNKERNLIHMEEFLHHTIPEAYESCLDMPVDERKVVFIEPRYNTLSNNFAEVYRILENYYDFDLKICLLQEINLSKEEFEQNCIDMVKEVATAKYVFLDEASRPFSAFKKRKETVAIQLWHGCGAFKKFGMSTADLIFGSNRESMEKFPFYANLDYVTVSSPEVIWAYEEAMVLKDKDTEIVATGVSRTDTFFRDDTKKKAYEKLYSLMPSARGKKVILYAPTFRGRVKKAKTPEQIDLGAFYAELSNDYVFLFKHHPIVKKLPEVPEEYKYFAYDMTQDMTIDELLCVADICISDYSSLVFEYSLFERPLIFFAFDIEEYLDWRGFYYNYDELTPGPVYKTNEDIINYIKNIDSMFDKQKVIDFKNKFMCSCDGHATERILKLAFGDALDANKRTRT